MSAVDVVLEPTRAAVIELTPEARAWFKATTDAIWAVTKSTQMVGRRVVPYDSWKETRELTPAEYDQLRTFITTYQLVCSLECSHFGFGISLVIYEHPVMPEFAPEVLFSLSQDHLPGNWRDNNKSAPVTRWETAWTAFTAFSHTARNRELLAYYKMPAPREKGYYAY